MGQGGGEVRGWGLLHQVMFGHEREVVVRHPGQQGQAMALSQRDGGAGQEEEENLREILGQIHHLTF